MKKIILLTVFFGKLPWYLNFFLKSCIKNPTIKFLIFTDQKKPENTPENVEFIPFSIAEFNKLASAKIGLPIEIKYAYKLCDFKAAYGVIFSEYLLDFDYWGITDIDLIFGRIREFITEEMLDEFEVISVRNDYPTGSFMVFKNEKKINNLFRKSKDHQKVFLSQKHYCFDECNFMHEYLEIGGNIFEIETEIESMHHVLIREMQINNLKVHFDFLIIEGLPGQLFWDNGILSFKNQFEVLFYHLISYKDNLFSKKRYWKMIPNQFYIDKYTIRKKNFISKLEFIFHEKIRIWFLNIKLNIEFYISCEIYPIKAKNIFQSKFINGNQERIIHRDLNNFNLISYNSNQEVFNLYQSYFRKNLFFVKNFKNIYYQLSSDKKSLLEISIDGKVFKLIVA